MVAGQEHSQDSDLTPVQSEAEFADEVKAVELKSKKRKRKVAGAISTSDTESTRKKRVRKTKSSEVDIETSALEVKSASIRKGKTKARDKIQTDETGHDDFLEEQATLTKSKTKSKGAKDDDADAEVSSPKKKRKPRAPKPEPVYVIPPVERKETSFKGRLGYACLNTILRNKKPASEAVFCSRTCRLDSIEKNGLEWVKDMGKRNMEDMLEIIQWNEDNHIKFMRLSSTVFPFASHPVHGYSLLEDPSIVSVLQRVGALANKYGHRITVHPGQFTQLGSPKEGVVDSSIKELVYHADMLEGMGIGKDGVMIIHGGGVYGDKESTLQRIKIAIKERLPQKVRDRLVLENDELCYSAEDLLPICEELDVPLVFDYHHDNLNPSSIPPSQIIARANAIFAKRGIRPKQHLSEPRPGAVSIMERRAHADRVETLPPDLPDDMDLMIEAKDKEQAVLHLYRIYNLQPVNHASLRPPADVITTQTKGRKSNKKAKKLQEGAEVDKLKQGVTESEDISEPVEENPDLAVTVTEPLKDAKTSSAQDGGAVLLEEDPGPRPRRSRRKAIGQSK